MEPTTTEQQARDALYTAVGFAVLGFQRAQVQRQQFNRRVRRIVAEAPQDVRNDIDAIAEAVEEGFGQLRGVVLPPADELVSVLQSATRHLREQILEPWVDAQDAGSEAGSTATSTTSNPATDDT